MGVFRIQWMDARQGYEKFLEATLCELGLAIGAISGCEGIEVIRDVHNERRFMFVERWTSVDAHKASVAMVPERLLRSTAVLVDGTARGGYFDTVLVN